MSTYTLPAKNTLQAGLRQSISTYREAIKEMLVPKFKIGDCFVTLTFNAEYKFHEVNHGDKLKKFHQKINRAIYGRAYDKGRNVLRAVSIAEYNNSNGVHIHMLLQRPEPNDRFRGDFDELVKSMWVSLNWDTVKCAQKIKPVYDVAGAVDYMTKQFKTPDQLIRMDINNTKW